MEQLFQEHMQVERQADQDYGSEQQEARVRDVRIRHRDVYLRVRADEILVSCPQGKEAEQAGCDQRRRRAANRLRDLVVLAPPFLLRQGSRGSIGWSRPSDGDSKPAAYEDRCPREDHHRSFSGRALPGWGAPKSRLKAVSPTPRLVTSNGHNMSLSAHRADCLHSTRITSGPCTPCRLMSTRVEVLSLKKVTGCPPLVCKGPSARK